MKKLVDLLTGELEAAFEKAGYDKIGRAHV